MLFTASLHSIRLSNIVLSIHQNIILNERGGQEVSAHGVCLPSACLDTQFPPPRPMDRILDTHTCENITFPQLLLRTVTS